jgi:hypothetical protein
MEKAVIEGDGLSELLDTSIGRVVETAIPGLFDRGRHFGNRHPFCSSIRQRVT